MSTCVKAMMPFVKNVLTMMVVNTVLGTLYPQDTEGSICLGSTAGGDSILNLSANSMCCRVYAGNSIGISALLRLLRRQESTVMNHTTQRSLEAAAGG